MARNVFMKCYLESWINTVYHFRKVLFVVQMKNLKNQELRSESGSKDDSIAQSSSDLKPASLEKLGRGCV